MLRPNLFQITVACTLAVASVPAGAEETASAPPAQQAGEVNPSTVTPQRGSPDEVVCKAQSQPVTGTLISRKRKVCKTRREWDQEKKDAEAFVQKVQEAGSTQAKKSN